MKTIVVPISNELKAKLDALRSRGTTINGFVRNTLERALAGPDDLHTEHLTKKQIERIEEAMNTDDLEVMVATVDRIIVKQRARKQLGRTAKGEAHGTTR